MRFKFLAVALIPILFMACAGKGSHTEASPHGSIAFSSLHSANTGSLLKGAASMAQAATATTTTANVFNFGNIPSTETYLFQIVNTGTAEVDNVTITTDNPAAIVTPGSIAVLPIQGTSSIVPITQVQVIHGVGQNGYGRAALLPPGGFVFHLTATGKDTQGNTVTATCEVDLYAQVAKMQITDYAGVDLMVGTSTQVEPMLESSLMALPPPGSNLNVFPLNGWYRIRTMIWTGVALDPSLTNYTVTNLGNVPLVISDFGNQNSISSSWIGTTNIYTVLPGGSQKVQFTFNPNTSDLAYFKLDGTVEHTILDPIMVSTGNVVWDSTYPSDSSGKFFFEYYWDQWVQ